MKMTLVILSPRDKKIGYSVLLRKGNIIYTDIKGNYIVPVSSIKALKKAKINFTVKPLMAYEARRKNEARIAS